MIFKIYFAQVRGPSEKRGCLDCEFYGRYVTCDRSHTNSLRYLDPDVDYVEADFCPLLEKEIDSTCVKCGG